MSDKKVFKNKEEFKDANTVTRIKSGTEKINTTERIPQLTASERIKKLAKDRLKNKVEKIKKLKEMGQTEKANELIKKVDKEDYTKQVKKDYKNDNISKFTKSAKKPSLAKRILRRIPGASIVESALSGEGATSALPILGSVDSLGPAKGSLSEIIENPRSSKEDRIAAIKKLRKESFKSKIKK